MGEVELNHSLTDCKHCISQKFDWSGYMLLNRQWEIEEQISQIRKETQFSFKTWQPCLLLKNKAYLIRIMRYLACTWLVSISNWTSFELSPWVWQAQLSPTASVDDITELFLVFFDEIMLPWQVLKIAKSKLQPDDPLLMGLGQG